MENDKSCFNCRYFLPYYVMSEKGRFLKILYRGHCISRNTNVNQSQKIIDRGGVCKFWEDENIVIEKRKKNIFETIEQIQNQLSHIEQILKEDLR